MLLGWAGYSAVSPQGEKQGANSDLMCLLPLRPAKCKIDMNSSTISLCVPANQLVDSFLLKKNFPFIFISWRLITLQYCSGYCHTLI